MSRLELTGIVRRFGPAGRQATALDGVDLSLAPGEIVGLVGESGSGKTTLARIAAGLDRPDAGTVRLNGQDLTDARGRMPPERRRSIQMVFQDPLASFNPRRSIGAAIALPLKIAGRMTASDIRNRVTAALRSVGLDPALAARRPDALSGGQLQRAAIARAIVTDPAILICDEPVASLDVSVRAQVLNLLADLSRSRRLAVLFVSHDLGVVQRLADRTVVLYLGRVVEEGARLLSAPRHPYTAALAASVPPGTVPWRDRSRAARAGGEAPSPFAIPSGCRFRTRCPHAIPVCAATDPALHDTDDGRVACLRVDAHGMIPA